MYYKSSLVWSSLFSGRRHKVQPQSRTLKVGQSCLKQHHYECHMIKKKDTDRDTTKFVLRHQAYKFIIRYQAYQITALAFIQSSHVQTVIAATLKAVACHSHSELDAGSHTLQLKIPDCDKMYTR